jgi:hypothetical protein
MNIHYIADIDVPVMVKKEVSHYGDSTFSLNGLFNFTFQIFIHIEENCTRIFKSFYLFIYLFIYFYLLGLSTFLLESPIDIVLFIIIFFPPKQKNTP